MYIYIYIHTHIYIWVIPCRLGHSWTCAISGLDEIRSHCTSIRKGRNRKILKILPQYHM